MYRYGYLAIALAAVTCGSGVVFRRNVAPLNPLAAHIALFGLALFATVAWGLALLSVGWFFAPLAVLAWALPAAGWRGGNGAGLPMVISRVSFAVFLISAAFLMYFAAVLVAHPNS